MAFFNKLAKTTAKLTALTATGLLPVYAGIKIAEGVVKHDPMKVVAGVVGIEGLDEITNAVSDVCSSSPDTISSKS